MTDEIVAYLERKGGLEILVEIGGRRISFQDLSGEVLVSSSTVSRRLEEGTDCGLFDITHKRADYGTKKRYKLTKVGKRVYDRAEELELDTLIDKRKRLHRECEQKKERLADQVTRDEFLIQESDELAFLDHQDGYSSEEASRDDPDVEGFRKRMLEEDLIEKDDDNSKSRSEEE